MDTLPDRTGNFWILFRAGFVYRSRDRFRSPSSGSIGHDWLSVIQRRISAIQHRWPVAVVLL